MFRYQREPERGSRRRKCLQLDDGHNYAEELGRREHAERRGSDPGDVCLRRGCLHSSLCYELVDEDEGLRFSMSLDSYVLYRDRLALL